MRRRRTYFKALALGVFLSGGFWGVAGATDRIVGAVAPSGGAYLIKHFRVPQGAVITGVRFVNNDPRTAFPRVVLFRGPTRRISEARILAEVVGVRPVSSHRVEVAFPPLVIGSATEIYVAIGFPANDGVRGVGVGPGIGARQLDADTPRTCYFAADLDGQFGAMDADYELDLLFLSANKAGAEEPQSEWPSAADARVRPNPFNPSVTIDFDVPRAVVVKVGIHDIAGRLVRLLVNERLAPGIYQRVWDAMDDDGLRLATGVYIARIQIGDAVMARKLVLTK